MRVFCGCGAGPLSRSKRRHSGRGGNSSDAAVSARFVADTPSERRIRCRLPADYGLRNGNGCERIRPVNTGFPASTRPLSCGDRMGFRARSSCCRECLPVVWPFRLGRGEHHRRRGEERRRAQAAHVSCGRRGARHPRLALASRAHRLAHRHAPKAVAPPPLCANTNTTSAGAPVIRRTASTYALACAPCLFAAPARPSVGGGEIRGWPSGPAKGASNWATSLAGRFAVADGRQAAPRQARVRRVDRQGPPGRDLRHKFTGSCERR